jgi:hypothetical protein
MPLGVYTVRMSAPTLRYRNTISGKIADLPEAAASVFADILEPVSDDAKPFEPGLFDSGTVAERAARQAGPDVIDVTTIAETPTSKVEEAHKKKGA